MAKDIENDKERIKNMLENIEFCEENIKDIDENEYCVNIKTQYALNMALQIICENANHITEKTKALNPDIKWKEMKTTRNFISHEYGMLVLDSAYDTIKNDLPILKKQLNDILQILK